MTFRALKYIPTRRRLGHVRFQNFAVSVELIFRHHAFYNGIATVMHVT